LWPSTACATHIAAAKNSVTRKAWVSKGMLPTRTLAREKRSNLLDPRLDLRTYIVDVTEGGSEASSG
jgi:hypothetical protein